MSSLPPIPHAPGQPLGMDPSEFASTSIPNLLTFGFEKVTPPSPLYIQRDDLLVVRSTTALAAADTLTVTVRLLLPVAESPAQPSAQGTPPASLPVKAGPGYIQIIQTVIKTGTPGNYNTAIIPLAEGFLLGVGITALNAPQLGLTSVFAYLGRGQVGGNPPIPAYPLITDYVTFSALTGWPNVSKSPALGGLGAISDPTVAAPGAGLDWTFNAQLGVRTRVRGFSALFQTSATVATRDVRFSITDASGNQALIFGAGITQAAGLTWNYSAGWGLPVVNDTATGALVSLGVPETDLPDGGHMGSVTTNLQAGDTWSQIRMLIEQWAQ